MELLLLLKLLHQLHLQNMVMRVVTHLLLGCTHKAGVCLKHFKELLIVHGGCYHVLLLLGIHHYINNIN